MRDNSCRERVSDALGGVDGVQDVSVSLLRAMAIVEHAPTCGVAELITAVEMAGYRAAPARGGEPS
jgi:copper chaperone CopZ